MSGYHKYVRLKMESLPEPWQTLKYEVCCWFLCVMCVASVKIHCQLVKLYEVCVIPWKQADTVHGLQQWWDRVWQGTKHDPLQMMCGVQIRSAADIRQLDIHWVVHRIVWDQLDYRSVCTLGARESHRWWQSSLYGTVWAFLISIGHVTLINWNMVNYTKCETRRMCDRETIISLQQWKWKHCHQ